MRFTRSLRSREYGALFVPVELEADRFEFDLLDCVCEIQFDAALFDTFPQVKILYDGVVQYAWDIPQKRTKQIEYRAYMMVW
jgi:hypothetical protein